MASNPILIRRLAALASCGLLAACGGKHDQKAPGTPEVGVVTLAAETVPIEVVLPGRTTAFETSEVRPQVNGLIQARKFVEGSIVHQGQTLYEIDPSVYAAAVAQAKANLANAEAQRTAAQAKAERYKPLVDINAVSKQDYTEAVAAAQQAAAQVAQTRAALQTAEINLRFTKVPAPITGRISRSAVTTGALVTNGQTTALATIERLDPMYVDIQQSSADLLALKRELSSGGAAPAEARVQLTLEDGSPYPQSGEIEFAEAIVDPNTGAVTLRARFPNPQGVLLPGMFVRAKVLQAYARGAVLAPQQALSRDPKGDGTVYVVGPDNKAQLRTVRADRTIGDKWLVASGLQPGDRVIVEGLDKVKPNQPVKPVAAGSPMHIGGQGGGPGNGQAGARGGRSGR